MSKIEYGLYITKIIIAKSVTIKLQKAIAVYEYDFTILS